MCMVQKMYDEDGNMGMVKLRITPHLSCESFFHYLWYHELRCETPASTVK